MAALPRLRALDGLRGLAVLAVVVYHYRPSWLPAGFLGVDLFFVLSGFLITSLLLVEARQTGRIALGTFWTRRLRRLLPALLALLAVLAASAAWYLSASGRRDLRGDALATLGYFANWRAVAEGDSYAARFAEPSVLRHAWSLAIEEQFYVVWPMLVALVVIATRRGGRDPARPLLAICAVGAIASAAAMWVLHDPLRDPSRVYYGTDTRAHAVLIGAALATLVRGVPNLAPGWTRTAAKVAAAVLLPGLVIAARALEFTDDRLYRGGFFLFALAAAIVLIGAVQDGRNVVRDVLEWRPLVLLGAVSYGVYLWHWPVLLVFDHDRTGLDGVALLALQLALTAAFTALSWYLVETPVRRGRVPARVVALATPAAVALVAFVVVAGTIVTTADSTGADSRRDAPPPVATVTALGPTVTDPTATGPDVTSEAVTSTTIEPVPTGPVKVLLVGDSVAWSIGGGAVDFPQPVTYESPFVPERVALWNVSRYACELLPGNSRIEGDERAPSGTCPEWERDWASDIEAFRPEVVMFTSTLWDTYDHKIDGQWVEFGSPEYDARWVDVLERLRDLSTARGATLALLSSPQLDNDQEPHTRRGESWRMAHLNELGRRFDDAHDDVVTIDVASFICPEPECPAIRTLRPDGLHYDLPGARVLAEWLTPQLEAIAGRDAGGPTLGG